MESMEETQLGSTMGASETAARSSEAERELDPSSNLGRYVILERLGAGAMGVVYAAYDPQLDRKVAVKLLRARGRDRSAAGARLQREAQALAKLAHPNVVAVHDVGEHEGQVFVAMEFVAGTTSSAWFRAQERSVSAIVEVFRSAGRGLAAAHRAGLVHRDFKPDNVMIDDEGRVRVMDFGLARGSDEAELGASVVEPGTVTPGPTTGALSARITQTGALLGTPAYMAPEQLLGRRADAKSDQFSFCVALWEALHGARPFAGDSAAAVMFAITQGNICEPPSGSQVPARLRRVLSQGLSAEPDARFGSMDALLDAIAPPRRGRAGWWAAAAVTVIAVAAVGYVSSRERASTPEPPCQHPDQALAGAWDDAQRARVKASLLGTEVSYAADTWSRVEADLDAWASRWVSQREDACADTRIRAEQSDEAMDLRMRCLDARRSALVATVEVLADADATVLSQAAMAVKRLPSLDRCEDVDSLRARQPPPEDPELAAKVEALDAKLAQIRALGSGGKVDDALALAREVDTQARALAWEPVLVRALVERGVAESEVGEYARSEATLTEAYRRALERRMLDEATSAASRLVFVLGFALNRPDEAEAWGLHAQALAIATESPEATGAVLNSLAAAAWSKGELEVAEALYREATDLLERSRGEDHPSVASVLQNRAILLNALGRTEEARALGDRALAMFESALGPEHPEVARAHVALAGTAFTEHHHEDARGHFERALDIYEGAYGSEHPELATTLAGLGVVAKAQGRGEEALAYHQRALPIIEEVFGPRHQEYAREWTNLGLAFMSLDRPKDALDAFERGLESWEAASSADNVELAFPLTGIGRALLELERADEAISPLERAVSLREGDHDQSALARSKYHLARALWDASAPGRDRGRALALAREAETGYAEVGDTATEELKMVRAWLADR